MLLFQFFKIADSCETEAEINIWKVFLILVEYYSSIEKVQIL